MNAIKKIPISESNQADLLRWNYSKNGEFSVRSTYHLEMQYRNSNVGSSSTDVGQRVYKRIWGADVPPRVKNMVWRAVNNGLPTMDTLARRGMLVDDRCPRCGETKEDIIHMVLQCKDSQFLWRISPARFESMDTLKCSFMDWCVNFITKCDLKRSWKLFMMFVWKIWQLRNLWVFEKKKIDPILACSRTLDQLGEYEAAMKSDSQPNHVDPPVQNRWHPPTEGMFKLNTDATISIIATGLGMVVRDNMGEVIMSAGTKMMMVIPAIQAEAETIRFGLRYANEEGIQSLEVESDCLTLVKQLQEKTLGRTIIHVIASDILVLANMFVHCSFVFANRKCNKVAHSMAKASLNFEEVMVWMEECPDEVVSLVEDDKVSVE